MIGKNEVAEVTYVGNNTTFDFAIPFKTWVNDDIVAYVVKEEDGSYLEIELGVDFSLAPDRKTFTLLTGAGKDWVGSNGLDFGYSLVISFDIEAYQPAQFNDLGSITPMKFQFSMDRLTMTLKAVKDLAARALSVGPGSGSAELPPFVGNGGKVVIVSPDEKGLEYSVPIEDVFTARDEAQQAAQDSASARDASISAKDDSEAAASAAIAARNAAQNFAESADLSAQDAATSESNASTYEEEAERWAHYYSFEQIKTITSADSPYQITYINDRGALILVDTSGGDVVIDLPSLGDMPDSSWKVAVAMSVEGNDITVNPFSGQTVNNGSSLTLNKLNIGVTFHDSSPTNWDGDYLIMGSFGSSATGGLPPGGDEGDYIEKQSNVEGDAVWESGSFSGFSATLNREVTATGLRDMISQLANFSYLPPLVTASGSGASTVREKGASLSSATITGNITKRSILINRIRFLKDGLMFADHNPPANQGSQTISELWSTPFSDTSTFTVEVSDEASDTGGPTTVTSSVTYTFVYPYYYGMGLPGATGAQVAALTKDIRTSTANITRSFSSAVGGRVFYFAYPKAYGALTSIKDQNNFETFPSWTQGEATITGLDGTPQVYYIYEYNNIQAAGSADFTFIR